MPHGDVHHTHYKMTSSSAEVLETTSLSTGVLVLLLVLWLLMGQVVR